MVEETPRVVLDAGTELVELLGATIDVADGLVELELADTDVVADVVDEVDELTVGAPAVLVEVVTRVLVVAEDPVDALLILDVPVDIPAVDVLLVNTVLVEVVLIDTELEN